VSLFTWSARWKHFVRRMWPALFLIPIVFASGVHPMLVRRRNLFVYALEMPILFFECKKLRRFSPRGGGLRPEGRFRPSLGIDRVLLFCSICRGAPGDGWFSPPSLAASQALLLSSLPEKKRRLLLWLTAGSLAGPPFAGRLAHRTLSPHPGREVPPLPRRRS